MMAVEQSFKVGTVIVGDLIFLNWAVSVEAPIAVVEAVPPVTVTVTASK